MEFKCDRIRIKSIIINKYIMYFKIDIIKNIEN